MTRSQANPWLHRFAVLTALVTLFLIGMGGLVTSHGVGLAVPDWPTTYGYNMFLFPISQWTGGVFYEHSHRLVASGVGLLTAVLAGWIWASETRGLQRNVGLGAIVLTLGLMGVRTQGMFIALACVAAGVIVYSFTRVGREERPLRWWAAIAFSAVLVQGVLGGLRVTALKDELGIFHGALAQLFFVLICAIALMTSRGWQELRQGSYHHSAPRTPHFAVGKGIFAATALIFLQLILGATMRHQHAGLAVPDFPLAYGTRWPPLDAASLEAINQQRLDVRDFAPITAFRIVLHMAHRFTAVLIFFAVAACAWRCWRAYGPRFFLTKLSAAWVGIILLQGVLGALTVLKNKPADIATLHVVVGAVSLAWGALLAMSAVGMERAVAARTRVHHEVLSAEPALGARRAVGTA